MEVKSAISHRARQLHLLKGLRFWRSPWVKAFWNRAYRENVTGMAAMVAYNLMLAIFPFVLLVLFVASQILRSPSIEASILNDLHSLFPQAEQNTLQHTLDRVRDSSTTTGVFAIIGGLWIGASFWGAMDTAFGNIYHVESRSWLAQKRFSLIMLFVVALLLAASVIVPTLEGAVTSTASDLPLGLSTTDTVANVVLVLGALATSFAVACVIYWATPRGHMPWRSVWPGALIFTGVMGVVNFAYPFYLGNISNFDRVGSTIGFLLIALLWFYVISLTLLAGAVINSIRHEKLATGELPVDG